MLSELAEKSHRTRKETGFLMYLPVNDSKVMQVGKRNEQLGDDELCDMKTKEFCL